MSNASVTVYSFEKYSITKDEWKKSRRMGTEKAIKELGGRPILETVTQVPESAVNGNGLTNENYSAAPNRTR